MFIFCCQRCGGIVTLKIALHVDLNDSTSYVTLHDCACVSEVAPSLVSVNHEQANTCGLRVCQEKCAIAWRLVYI